MAKREKGLGSGGESFSIAYLEASKSVKVVSYLCNTAGLLGKVVYVTYEVHMCPYANKRRGKMR